MSQNFISTVTIPLEEYQSLKRHSEKLLESLDDTNRFNIYKRRRWDNEVYESVYFEKRDEFIVELSERIHELQESLRAERANTRRR